MLFILLIAQGLMIAYKAENQFCTMVGIGIMAQIAWQVFCNIAVVTNAIPNTGILSLIHICQRAWWAAAARRTR